MVDVTAVVITHVLHVMSPTYRADAVLRQACKVCKFAAGVGPGSLDCDQADQLS